MLVPPVVLGELDPLSDLGFSIMACRNQRYKNQVKVLTTIPCTVHLGANNLFDIAKHNLLNRYMFVLQHLFNRCVCLKAYLFGRSDTALYIDNWTEGSGAVTVPSEMFHGIPWARETRHKHCVVLDLHLQGLRLGRGQRRRHNILALFMQPLIHQVLELTMHRIL